MVCKVSGYGRYGMGGNGYHCGRRNVKQQSKGAYLK